ncbi:MAG: type 12 [Geobacteraceae bacterium]|nr:MAG: type 12 [Geobacteraceae bacterium]
MERDKAKWNERYDREEYLLGLNPSRFLEERIDFIISVCPGRKALDIACGEGRNSIFLARHGFTVTGLDISEAGIDKAGKRMAEEGLQIDFRLADLERYEFPETYDLVINFNFLLRDLIPKEVQALNSGGILVFDTILDAPSLQGVHNPHYLLQPGELRTMFERFAGVILHYEERPHDATPTAKLIFQKA